MPLFFFPIGDDNRGRTIKPVVNYALLAINIAVFFLLQSGSHGEKFTMAFSTVPKEIVTGQDIVTDPEEIEDPATGQVYLMPGLEPTPIPVWGTLLTAMFMHGGIMHLLGNMLYLWIFGDNIEDEMGHGRYLAFYLLCGILAGLSHVLLNAGGPSALVPCLGASGAIAGVLGGYLMRHPTRGVHVIAIRVVITLPAWVVVGMWFVMQVIGGLGTSGQEGGGVAYAAHIGGFIAGLALVTLFVKSNPQAGSATPDQRDRWRQN
ncbi:MAG: rhomboid family intramembrane serine protease [Planctomycetaceae bacterium]|jgi:membrane associated rhomboid family serine protease|nr:rhomboid family intramembrane serine protease [Planctomycetaceae bacterium]